MRLETGTGRRIELLQSIGDGGQGKVFHLNGDDAKVVKLYHQPSPKLQAKIQDLVDTPTDRRVPERFAAWPTDVVYEVSGPWFWRKRTFVGCLMPYVADSYPIFHMYTPKMQKKHNWRINWGHMHQLGHSLAELFSAFHDKGIVIGDVNSRNILANTSLALTLIDVDSVQISPQHTSDVGVEEYTPPELMKRSLKGLVRSEHHDLFGLGYLLFQLLMKGASPFAGIAKVDLKAEHVEKRCKELGIFPFFENQFVAPPPGMPHVTIFHPQVAEGFFYCFIGGRKNPDLRPSARTWLTKFGVAERELIRCKREREHVYSSHLRRCPWC